MYIFFNPFTVYVVCIILSIQQSKISKYLNLISETQHFLKVDDMQICLC